MEVWREGGCEEVTDGGRELRREVRGMYGGNEEGRKVMREEGEGGR